MDNPIQVVIVLYKKTWSDVYCMKILENWILKNQRNQLLIYDNSPNAQDTPFFYKNGVSYIHNPNNPGLSEAYNLAFENAKKSSIAWLLLLDQDTELSLEYFEVLDKQLERNKNVVCHVPVIFSKGKQISPLSAQKYIDRNWEYPNVGIENKRVMAINSASIWRTSFLKELNGFSNEFPLDFLDHWLFFQVYKYNKSVNILPISIEHELSILNYDTMSSVRYRSILKAERTYYTKIEPELFLRHKKQLVLRMAKQFFTFKNRKVWKLTWLEFSSLRKEHI